MSIVDQIVKSIYTYKAANPKSPKQLHLGYETWCMLKNEFTYDMFVFKQDKSQEDSFAGLTVIIDDHCKYKIEIK